MKRRRRQLINRIDALSQVQPSGEADLRGEQREKKKKGRGPEGAGPRKCRLHNSAHKSPISL